MARKKQASGSGNKLMVGLSKAIINPPMGANLVGYFNERLVKGVLDDLHVRVALFKTGNNICGLLSYDIVSIPNDLDEAIRSHLKKSGIKFTENLSLTSIHTHTGPSCGSVWALEKKNKKEAKDYIDYLCKVTSLAVEQALLNMVESEMYVGSVINNPYAFNRRYWMKDGTVATNPGKLNPNIEKPEGPVDREIGICVISQYGEPACIITNITNHTDTMGGDWVSSDWPGFMERYIQDSLGKTLPVFTLVGPQGNINHFDITSEDPQTCYEEAERIGSGYAEIVLSNLDKVKKIAKPDVAAQSLKIKIPYRKIDKEKIKDARALLKRESADMNVRLTSEDIIKGGMAIKLVFARKLVDFVDRKAGESCDFVLRGIKFSKDFAVVSLPGEPFTEIGLGIKAKSPFEKTFVSALSNGGCGYVPMPDCFGRGGYEILPTPIGGTKEDTSLKFIENGVKLLKKF